MSKGLFYLAVLTGMLMILAYYVGASNLLSTGGSVAQKLGYTFSGRDAQGHFANYPQGG